MASFPIKLAQWLSALSDEEARAVRDVTFGARSLEADQSLVHEGDRPAVCPLLLAGFACRYKTLRNGQRQIVAFHVPGDFCGLPSLLLNKLDYSTVTLTPAKVVFISYAVVQDWMTRHLGLRRLLWQATLVDASTSREWMVSIGRRTAYQRTAHLLCELTLRMQMAGLADGLSCEMPFTQVELADALGLTPVHLNRTLQWLRSCRLIELSGGTLKVLNWHELSEAAEFDPAYLHQSAIAG